MDNFKRFFRCVKPQAQFSLDEAKTPSPGAPQKTSPRQDGVLLLNNYKQQHVASLAESQAVFDLQKNYIEKRIGYIHTQIEKIDHLNQKILHLENTYQRLQTKVDLLTGDPDWVKFE